MLVQQFGIDISEWQDGFPFDKAVAEGVGFVILRGADHLYKDRCFEEFYAQCQKRGIPVGVYHYSRATTEQEAVEEAEFLLQNVLKGKNFAYPVYMDVEAEKQKKVGKKQLTDAVLAFCRVIREAGFLPGVYSSLSFLNSYLDDSRLGDVEKWIAQWYTHCQYTGQLGMWQFGGETNLIRSNRVAGVVCDQNYAYKNYPEQTGTTKQKKGDFTLTMRVLRAGCTGADVRALQLLLMGNGWDGGLWGADGNFGAQTGQAVATYQTEKKLQIDGEAGPETMKSLLGIA